MVWLNSLRLASSAKSLRAIAWHEVSKEESWGIAVEGGVDVGYE